MTGGNDERSNRVIQSACREQQNGSLCDGSRSRSRLILFLLLSPSSTPPGGPPSGPPHSPTPSGAIATLFSAFCTCEASVGGQLGGVGRISGTRRVLRRRAVETAGASPHFRDIANPKFAPFRAPPPRQPPTDPCVH